MLSRFKRLRQRLAAMCPAARSLLLGCLRLSLVLLAASLLFRVAFDAEGILSFRHLALDLLQAPVSILLIGFLGSAVLEDRFGQET